MNHSIRLLFAAGLIIFCSAGFTQKPAAPEPPVSAKQGQLYYWYTQPYDQFNDQKTLADEKWELWSLYFVLIDTDPIGGTLLMKGYFNNAYPHNQWALVFLYGHF